MQPSRASGVAAALSSSLPPSEVGASLEAKTSRPSSATTLTSTPSSSAAVLSSTHEAALSDENVSGNDSFVNSSSRKSNGSSAAKATLQNGRNGAHSINSKSGDAKNADSSKAAKSGTKARKKPAFRPAYETFGPMRNTDARHVKYKPPETRQGTRENLASEKGSVFNLNCDDTLRRVSVVIHRHIMMCERRRLNSQRESSKTGTPGSIKGRTRRYESVSDMRDIARARGTSMDDSGSVRNRRGSLQSSRGGNSVRGRLGRFDTDRTGDTSFDDQDDEDNNNNDEDSASSASGSAQAQPATNENGRYRGALGLDVSTLGNASDLLSEDLYLKAQYKYAFLRLPRLPLWVPYRMERVERTPEVPSVERIYSFARHLFVEAELSSECSVVCLVYVERLMERANVQLYASNWRPIVLAGMLLASKVWQDLSSWNIEFARIYPHFTLQSINLLERNILKLMQWDLFISGATYAKYYFALRSLNESRNFRRRYNYIMRVNAPGSKQLEKRSAAASNTLYSRSM